MSGKDFLKTLVQSFFIVVTLINVAMYILGRTLQPDRLCGYEVFLYPILYGFCSMIPIAVMYSGKELTIRQILIRKVIQLSLIILVLNVLIFRFEDLTMENIPTIAGVCASIVIVYVLAEAFSWFLNNQAAKKLTDELLAYQKDCENDT